MIDIQSTSNLSVQMWADPPQPGPGIDLRSRYADHFWVPVIGPTAMYLLRVLARNLGREPGGVSIPVSDLMAELGLDRPSGRSEIVRALDRLMVHGLVAAGEGGSVVVRLDLPYLSQIEVERLAPHIAVAHRAALVLRDSAVTSTTQPPLTPRLLSLTATVDDLLTNGDLDSRQLAYRWQHVMRLAEEARDEAILDWASPDLEVTLAEGQLSAQAMNEAVWAAQHLIAQDGTLPAEARATVNEAAAGMVDWVVSEFPDETDAWDEAWIADQVDHMAVSFEDLLGILERREAMEDRSHRDKGDDSDAEGS